MVIFFAQRYFAENLQMSLVKDIAYDQYSYMKTTKPYVDSFKKHVRKQYRHYYMNTRLNSQKLLFLEISGKDRYVLFCESMFVPEFILSQLSFKVK